MGCCYVRTGVPQSQSIASSSFVHIDHIDHCDSEFRSRGSEFTSAVSPANKEASKLSCSVNAAQTGKASETLDSRDVAAVMLDEKGEGRGGRERERERIASQRG